MRDGVILRSTFHASQAEGIGTWLPRKALKAVEVFCPYPREIVPGKGLPVTLGDPREDSREHLVRLGCRTIEFADEHEVPFIIVPATSLGGELVRYRPRLTAGYLSDLERRALVGFREEEVGRPLDAFRAVISRLLDAASRYRARLVVVPGGWLDEFPSPVELLACLREFRGAPLGVWLDTWRMAVPAVKVLHSEAWDGLAAELAGAFLRDHDEDHEEVSLGEGRADWEAARPWLERCSVWAAELKAEAFARDAAAVLETVQRIARGPETKLTPGFYLH
jgi:hypothetical protein